MGRLTQSFLKKSEAGTQVYTDDPCIVAGGSQMQRDRIFALMILAWRALGFPLSWSKGCRGKLVNWIGGEFRVLSNPTGVRVKIKQDVFQAAASFIEEVRHLNVLPRKRLPMAIGKLSHIANLLVPWRPFLTALYAALYGVAPGAPADCIWMKQIARSVEWFHAFFQSSGGLVERTFLLDSHLAKQGAIELVIDASPWGLAGILVVDGRCEEFFSDAISDLDVAQFGCAIGSPDGQQIWESLAALIAIRLWRPRWAEASIQLKVRGDSITMLTLVVNLRPSTPQLSLIGQEIALEFARCSFVPIIAEHIPGLANVSADALSRWHQPGHHAFLPAPLTHATRRTCQRRDQRFYLTLASKIEPNKWVIEGS